MRRGSNHSIEAKEKMRQARIKFYQYNGNRERQSQTIVKLWQNPDSSYRSDVYQRNIKQARIKMWQNEEYREKRQQAIQVEEVREKMSQRRKEFWQESPEKYLRTYRSKEFREKSRQIRAELWQNPDSPYNSGEYREAQRQIRVKLWQDEEFVRKVFNGLQLKPNKAELKLDNFLQQLVPNQYQYTGNGKLIIGGKCPDFASTDGQKKLIELFGNYWHEGQDPQERIDHFHKYGYDALVIWESELTDLPSLKDRIVRFLTINQRKEVAMAEFDITALEKALSIKERAKKEPKPPKKEAKGRGKPLLSPVDAKGNMVKAEDMKPGKVYDVK